MEFKPKGKTIAPHVQTVQRQAQPGAKVPQLPVRAAEASSLQRFMQPAVTEQRHVVQPVFQAASLQRAEDERISMQRQAVTQQASQFSVPSGAIEAALQRQQQPTAPVPLKPQSTGDWVTVMRFQAEQAVGRRMTSRESGQFTALQRQVAQTLTQGYLRDRQPALQRQQEYAGHIATLQRHPISGHVAQVFMRSVPAGERPVLQRAVDEVVQREALQRQQDEQALQLHSLQRQLAELDHEATQPVFQRIQARRGSGNPLPEAVQRHLEQGLNHDLSGVRIHDDAEADKMAKGVNAIAFTTGTDIFFQSGKFNPNTQTGMELLAHEVTHTIQQGRGEVGPGIDPSSSHESQAQEMGRKMARRPIKNSAVTEQKPRQAVKPTHTGIQRKAATPLAPARAITVAAVVNALVEHYKAVSRVRNARAGSPIAGAVTSLPNPPAILTQAVNSKANDAKFWQEVMKTLAARKDIDTQLIQSTLPANVRERMSYGLLGGAKNVTYMALMNQFAFMSYSNTVNLSDVKGMAPDANSKTSTAGGAKAILDAAGYDAMPTIQGLWGFQMRVFKPRAAAKKKGMKTVVAFRGTEGVAVGTDNPLMRNASTKTPLRPVRKVQNTADSQKDNQGFIDSMTDFVPYPTGYSQYEANRKDIIDPAINALGKNLVAVGHSLGGALAQLAVAKHPGVFSEVYTFQGAKIQASDVQAFEQKQKTIQSSFYSVNGDVVPTSGQASIGGMKHRFERETQMSLNVGDVLDAAGGHNSPIMLEELRKFQKLGLMGSSDPLANALAKYGSRDAMNPVDLIGTGHDFTPHPDREGLKQAVVGKSQVSNFVKVYLNNAVYNAYAQDVLPQLRTVQPKSSSDLIIRLAQIATQASDMSSIPGMSAGNKTTLKAIFGGVDYDVRVKQLRDQVARIQQQLDEYRNGRRDLMLGGDRQIRMQLQTAQQQLTMMTNMKAIDPAIIAENQIRFRRDLIDLWYSVHSGDEQAVKLYQGAKQQWANLYPAPK